MSKVTNFFHYLKPYRLIIIAEIITDLFSNFLGLLAPLFAIIIFDYAYPNRNFPLFIKILLAGFGIYILQTLLSSLTDYLHEYTKVSTTRIISKIFIEKIGALSAKKFDHLNRSDLIIRATDDTEIISSIIVSTPQVLVINFVTLFFLLSIAFHINPLVTFLAILSVPLNWLEAHFFSNTSQKLLQHEQQTQANLYSSLYERLANFHLIKCFGREKQEEQKVLRCFKTRNSINLQKKIIELVNVLSHSFTVKIWSTLVTGFIGWEVITGKMTVGHMMALTAYLAQFWNPIREFTRLYSSLRIAQVSADRLNEIILSPSTDHSAQNQPEKNTPPLNTEANFVFSNISFSYSNQCILKDISLKIEDKTLVAIVGASGSGKSTLIKILAGLYQPDNGGIFLNGNKRDPTHGFERNFMAYVPQEIALFKRTLRENICFGSGQSEDSEITQACQLADAYDFMNQLPQQYDFQVDELGTNLSGGQRQRIALARALILKPKILLLDEVSSALDPESEYLIFNALQKCKKNMTIVTATHRLNNLKGFDNIVVLKEGMIQEQGNFFDLMARKGAFFNLYQLQTTGFGEFQQRLETEFSRFKRYHTALSLIGFRVENEESSSNNFVRSLHQHINHYLRAMDFSTIYRDRMVLLCLPDTSLSGSIQVEKRINLIINKYIQTHGIHHVNKFNSCAATAHQSMKMAEQLIQAIESDLDKTSNDPSNLYLYA